MGVQILNKDVSVISSVMGRPKAGIASIWGATGWSGGGTWTLAFGDTYILTAGSSITQTIPQNVTLYFEIINIIGGMNWSIYKNNSFVVSYSTNTQTTATQSFNANDTLYFTFAGTFFDGNMEIKENNSSGRLIDTFYISVTD